MDLHTTKNIDEGYVLSGRLETERIAASLKDGLLTVCSSKRVKLRTRTIKVDVAFATGRQMIRRSTGVSVESASQPAALQAKAS